MFLIKMMFFPLKMTCFTKNYIFHIDYLFLQYYDTVNHSNDFCPILSRSQNIVHCHVFSSSHKHQRQGTADHV